MMREIARGVVDDRDRKVTKNDTNTALRYNIEKMVCASKDISHMLSRMSYEGLDDQRMHLLLRMKEIAHGIVDKKPRVATRPELLADQLIIRSHEGPDARAGRDDFGDMFSGYSIDHDGESGKLYTLFSSPDYPQLAKDGQLNQLVFIDKDVEASTSGFSAPQDDVRPKFDFESLGIYNAPSWSVQLPDGSGGTQVVQVPRAPSVEGLPLPPNIQEPHKGAYEYLFELVAGLKHMIATRETENMALVSALRSRARKRKGRGHS